MSNPPSDFVGDGGSAAVAGSLVSPAYPVMAHEANPRVASSFLIGGISRVRTAVCLEGCFRPRDARAPGARRRFQTSPKRVDVVGGPLSKGARRRSDDVHHIGRHERGASEGRAPCAEQHVHDRARPPTRRVLPELFGRQLVEPDPSPNGGSDGAHLGGLTQRLGAGEDVVPSRVPVLVERTRGHGRDVALQRRNTARTPCSAAWGGGGPARSPATTSTAGGRRASAGRRVSARTGTPASSSWATSARPTRPVAPVTRTGRIFACVTWAFRLCQDGLSARCAATRRAPIPIWQ